VIVRFCRRSSGRTARLSSCRAESAMIERLPELSSLRVRTRGVDPEAAAVLLAIRQAAMLWRSGFACATDDAPKPQPAASS
jgi:hypothetical protein